MEKLALDVNTYDNQNMLDAAEACLKVASMLLKGNRVRSGNFVLKVGEKLNEIACVEDEKAKECLSHNYIQDQLKLLLSSTVDVRGLNDTKPNGITYEKWLKEVSALKRSLRRLIK